MRKHRCMTCKIAKGSIHEKFSAQREEIFEAEHREIFSPQILSSENVHLVIETYRRIEREYFDDLVVIDTEFGRNKDSICRVVSERTCNLEWSGQCLGLTGFIRLHFPPLRKTLSLTVRLSSESGTTINRTGMGIFSRCRCSPIGSSVTLAYRCTTVSMLSKSSASVYTA